MRWLRYALHKLLIVFVSSCKCREVFGSYLLYHHCSTHLLQLTDMLHRVKLLHIFQLYVGKPQDISEYVRVEQVDLAGPFIDLLIHVLGTAGAVATLAVP